MKRFISPLTAGCLAFTALLTLSHGEVSPIRVQVEAKSKTDKSKDGTTQTRVLNITVSNSGAEAAELKVQYAVFARDVDSKEIITVGEGELPVSVKPRGTEKVEAPAAKSAVVDAKPGKGKEPKKDASGAKIVGHGAKVLQGETVVAEFFEPASMKPSFGTTTPRGRTGIIKK
jgi:hypothetical protein